MKIAVCDDESFQRSTIQTCIEKYVPTYPSIRITEFSSGEELIHAYSTGENFDFLFLDIKMRDMDGIKAAEEIRKTDQTVIIIFVTSFVQYVSAAFRLNDFQFLVKPVSQSNFDREFERAINQYLTNHFQYRVKWRDQIQVVEISKMQYIETNGKHLLLHTADGTLEFVGKIGEEEKRLYNYGFVRVHQAFLVNMAFIKTINKGDITLKNGTTVLMSKYMKPTVLERFNLYLSGCCL